MGLFFERDSKFFGGEGAPRMLLGTRSRPVNRWLRLLSSSILIGACPTALAAQAAPLVVPPTREEITRPIAPQPVNRAPQLEVEGGIERAPCALDGPNYQSIHFVLRGVEFDGLQAIGGEQLAAAYAPYVGRDVPISVVCEIRDRAGTMLRDAGYIAAVQVPEQKIADGVVRFRVLMARVTQVRVRGGRRWGNSGHPREPAADRASSLGRALRAYSLGSACWSPHRQVVTRATRARRTAGWACC